MTVIRLLRQIDIAMKRGDRLAVIVLAARLWSEMAR